MNEIRSRTRQPLQGTAQTIVQRPSLLKTGAQAEAARVLEADRQNAVVNKRWQPQRLWIPYQGDEANRTKEYIILDSDISQCPMFYEHNLPNPNNDGKRTDFQMCVKEIESCPLCEQYGDSYYVQMITIMELLATPWVTRDGKEVNHMRRLLPVKYQQQEWFKTTCNNTLNGNMRGAHIVTVRESNQKSSVIGTPQLFIDEQSRTVTQYNDQQLQAEFGHPELKSKDGRVIKQANEDTRPFDYQKLFQTPSGEDLRRMYGGTVPAGSAQETQQAWQDQPVSGGIKRQTAPTQNNGSSDNEDYLDDPSSEIPF